MKRVLRQYDMAEKYTMTYYLPNVTICGDQHRYQLLDLFNALN